MELLAFWQKVDPDTGRLVHDFTDPERGTRFLGDLYQDLSESARKRYALLQTPIFVEEFILDRTLTPAIDEFGYREVRLVDPTCGSGHFRLGPFQRLFDVWARREPARNLRDLAQQALNGVYGVDVNPLAVAIARFRLLLAALVACDETRLKDAPAFTIHLAAGDSLLHGRRFNQLDLGREAENLARGGLAHVYKIEDLDEINRILGQQYHVVVGNPPYITVKDGALNAAYRSRYATCHMKYSLAVPFTERFLELALPGNSRRHPGESRGPGSSERLDSGLRGYDEVTGNGLGAGYVGMITANSFMKREFGSKLIEQFLPGVDLTHVIDTSGASI
ncbi:MAG: BREX-2 system adenine-specific DNA-methyltransferase PglX, partial [Gammaproteobacteria bacterium]